jgi:hypothetical protein
VEKYSLDLMANEALVNKSEFTNLQNEARYEYGFSVMH